MYFFGDNYECKVGKLIAHNIFCYGGFLVQKGSIKSLEAKYAEIKNKYNIPEWLPLKWNLLDTKLRDTYKLHDKELLWNNVKNKSKEIRLDVIGVLREFDCKIIFCSFRDLSLIKNKRNLIQWAFTNILQRAYFESQSLELILDWDEEIRDIFFESHQRPYYFGKGKNGETFYPVCLQNIKNSMPFLSFSSTLYNPFLQLTDIIVGCCGSFIEYALKNEKRDLVKYLFPTLAQSIRGYKNGDVFSWGFIVNPPEDKKIIMQKFEEITKIF